MKITVIIEDITIEVDMPHTRCVRGSESDILKTCENNKEIAFSLIKDSCAHAIELYKAKHA